MIFAQPVLQELYSEHERQKIMSAFSQLIKVIDTVNVVTRATFQWLVCLDIARIVL